MPSGGALEQRPAVRRDAAAACELRRVRASRDARRAATRRDDARRRRRDVRAAAASGGSASPSPRSRAPSRCRPSGWNQSGWLREYTFQSIDGQLRVLLRGGLDVVVHRQVRMARRAQGQPPDVRDARRLRDAASAVSMFVGVLSSRSRCSRPRRRRSGRASSPSTWTRSTSVGGGSSAGSSSRRPDGRPRPRGRDRSPARGSAIAVESPAIPSATESPITVTCCRLLGAAPAAATPSASAATIAAIAPFTPRS